MKTTVKMEPPPEPDHEDEHEEREDKHEEYRDSGCPPTRVAMMKRTTRTETHARSPVRHGRRRGTTNGQVRPTTRSNRTKHQGT